MEAVTEIDETNGTGEEASSEEAGEWVPKKEAAYRLNITERMIDKRVELGRLRKRFSASGKAEFLVPLAETDLQVDKAFVLVGKFNEALTVQTAPLVERIAAQAEEIGRLKARVAELEQGRGQQAKPWWRFW